MKALPAKLVVLVLVTFSAAFLMIVVAAVMTWATGWVTEAQMSDIMTILRGETLEQPQVVEPVSGDLLARERALLEIVTKTRKAQEEDRRAVELELERKKTEFQVVRQDAQRMIRELEAKLEELTRQKKRFQAERLAYQESLTSEGLRKLKEVLESLDATEAAQKLLSCVFRTGQRFGANHVVDVLLGHDTDKIRRFEHDQLSTYGIGSELSGAQWRSLVRQFCHPR